MYLKVEKIKKMANNQYKIIFEDGHTITTYDEVILKNNVLFHKEIDDELLKKIEEDEEYYSLYNDAIKYIEKCIHSKKEMIDYLEKKGGKEEDKDKIIQTLEEKGLINDDIFCASFISDKFYLSHYGPLKIKKELENHQIDEKTIIKHLSTLPEKEIYDTLYKMVDKKIRLDHKHAKSVLKQKLISYFLEKGFEGEMVAQIFDELYKEDSSILYKEYESVKRKLEKKYEGKELEYHIVQRLYQKGFLKEQIDQIKEESN